MEKKRLVKNLHYSSQAIHQLDRFITIYYEPIFCVPYCWMSLIYDLISKDFHYQLTKQYFSYLIVVFIVYVGYNIGARLNTPFLEVGIYG